MALVRRFNSKLSFNVHSKAPPAHPSRPLRTVMGRGCFLAPSVLLQGHSREKWHLFGFLQKGGLGRKRVTLLRTQVIRNCCSFFYSDCHLQTHRSPPLFGLRALGSPFTLWSTKASPHIWGCREGASGRAVLFLSHLYQQLPSAPGAWSAAWQRPELLPARKAPTPAASGGVDGHC